MRVAFHKNDRNHGNGNQGNDGHDENHGNPGANHRFPKQTTGLEWVLREWGTSIHGWVQLQVPARASDMEVSEMASAKMASAIVSVPTMWVHAEIPYRLPFWREFCWIFQQ